MAADAADRDVRQGNRVKHEYSYLNPKSCGGPTSNGILSAESILS